MDFLTILAGLTKVAAAVQAQLADLSASVSKAMQALDNAKADKSHTHDDRYYTESEVNGKLKAKAENIVLATSTNLNNVVTPGFYNCGGSNSVTNKPSGVDAFGLIVIHNANGGYYTQILSVGNGDYMGKSYRRTCTNGTWSAWTQDKYTDTNTWRDVVNNLTSSAIDQSLSAAQGKALKTMVDAKADKVTLTPITIPATGWKQDSGSYPWYVDIPVSGLTAADVAAVQLDPAGQSVAEAACFWSYSESVAGAIRLRAKRQPTAALAAYYYIIGRTT